MFRVAVCSVLIASVIASRRIQEHDFAKSQTKFGASCEDLQASFRSRVAGLQTLLDAHPEESTFNRATQARFTMRTLGIVRTLRRARTCAWVVDGDSDDIEQIRDIVQVMLAGNPCAQVARGELAAGTSAGSVDMQAVRRAMSVLVSDSCEVTLPSDEDDPTFNPNDDAELDAQIAVAEAQAQDVVEEFMDVSYHEENGGAFVETSSDALVSGIYGGVRRTLGVVFLSILLMLACVGVMAFIGIFVGLLFLELQGGCYSRGCVYAVPAFMGMGMFGGGVVGLGVCSYQLFTRLLPSLEQ